MNDASFGDEFQPDKPEVPISGDGPYFIGGGTTSFLIGGACPEVAMFEPQLFFMGLNHAPTIKGQYDKYMEPKYEVLETGHFSECAEYSLATTDQNFAVQSPAQQEITRQTIAKLDELFAALEEAKVDETSKSNVQSAIEDAKKSPTPGTLKRAAEAIGPIATIIDAGSKIFPHLEALIRLAS